MGFFLKDNIDSKLGNCLIILHAAYYTKKSNVITKTIQDGAGLINGER